MHERMRHISAISNSISPLTATATGFWAYLKWFDFFFFLLNVEVGSLERQVVETDCAFKREFENEVFFRLLLSQNQRNAKRGRSKMKNRTGARSNIGINGHGRYRTYAWSTNSSFLFR